MLTYQDLLETLQNLTPKKLQENVTLFDSSADEFYPATSVGTAENDDVLDAGHFFIRFNG